MPKPNDMTEAGNSNGEETSTDSSTENNNEGETGSSAGTENQGGAGNGEGQGGQHQDDEFKDLPFHEHPRWKQREQEWNEKFEKQESSVSDRIKTAIQEAMKTTKPQTDDANDTIPVWFGGGKDTPEVRKMWNEYKKENQKILDEAVKKAREGVITKDDQSSQAKSVEEANKHFESSITSLEATYGKKIDRKSLLDYVLKNQIIDHKTQKWDYVNGYRWMMAEAGTPVQARQNAGTQGGNSQQQTRKKIAGATTQDSGKGNDGGGKDVISSETFKDPSKRPW